MRIANTPASESAPGTHRPVERPLFEAPRIRTADEGERRTSWLEFFFDLVFVVAVDQVARRLQGNATPESALTYAALYAPIWWAWVGYVFYTNRFGTDDLGDRLITLLQIAAVVVIAACAQEAVGERSAAFAIAYGSFRLILAGRYGLAARFVREARKVATLQGAGFALAGAIWIVSAFVPAPLRYVLWFMGFVVDIATPFVASGFHNIVPPDAGHIEERFGTFINISLGEGFLGLVEAMREEELGGAPLVTAALSLVIGFSIWWSFFERLDLAPIQEVRRSGRVSPLKVWVFSHLPLAAGVAAVGIAVGNVVHAAAHGSLNDSNRWLIAGMVALCYSADAVVQVAYARSGGGWRAYVLALRNSITVVIALAVGAFGSGLSPVSVIAALAVASGGQVVADIWVSARTKRTRGANAGPGLAPLAG